MAADAIRLAVPYYIYPAGAFSAGEIYRITYMDNDMRMSARDIRIETITTNDQHSWALDAHCSLCNELRTFLTCRIKSATAFGSGEIMEPSCFYKLRYVSPEEVTRHLKKVAFEVSELK